MMMDCTWAPGITLEQMEKMVIQKALVVYENNKVRTSQALGITPQTLRNKIELYDLQAKKLKESENAVIQRERDVYARERQANTFQEGGAYIAQAAERDREKARVANEQHARELAENQRKREEYLASKKAQAGSGADTNAKSSVEPAQKSSKEHAVPVSKSEKVQEVLSVKASTGSSDKGSKTVSPSSKKP